MFIIVLWLKYILVGIFFDKFISILDLFFIVVKLVGGDVFKDRVIDGKDLLLLLIN